MCFPPMQIRKFRIYLSVVRDFRITVRPFEGRGSNGAPLLPKPRVVMSNPRSAQSSAPLKGPDQNFSTGQLSLDCRSGVAFTSLLHRFHVSPFPCHLPRSHRLWLLRASALGLKLCYQKVLDQVLTGRLPRFAPCYFLPWELFRGPSAVLAKSYYDFKHNVSTQKS